MFLNNIFPQHYCRHCHLQRHQNGLLALPFSHMVDESSSLFTQFCKVWSLHVHHASPFAPTSGLFLCRGQLRRRQSYSGSCCRHPTSGFRHSSSFQSILPTEKRVHMFQYLYGHPIQMTVYGHAISYGTIGNLC